MGMGSEGNPNRTHSVTKFVAPDVPDESEIEEQFTKAEYRSPERNLCVAVLQQAILDYLGFGAIIRSLGKDHVPRPTHVQIFNEVSDWLFSDEEVRGHPFSFSAICSITGIDPDRLRELISILAKKELSDEDKTRFTDRNYRTHVRLVERLRGDLPVGRISRPYASSRTAAA